MTYELLPLVLSPARREIISRIMRKIASVETAFTGFGGECEEECISRESSLEEMCAPCRTKMAMVATTLGKSDARAFEVWNEDEIAGVIYFTGITPRDATGHYVFFDGRLKDKTDVLEEAINVMFAELELSRLTVEIPSAFPALARHAQKRLKFGGPFRHETETGDFFKVEGVKRKAVSWRGRVTDLMVMGRLKDS